MQTATNHDVKGQSLRRSKKVDYQRQPTLLEICAGAGGQAIGFESAGFAHVGLVEIDPDACATLRQNRPEWKVLEQDVRHLDAQQFHGVDVLAGGVPCPPFSIAGTQQGPQDDRDLFPEMLRLTAECRPKIVVIENVRGLAGKKFDSYRDFIIDSFQALGYFAQWRLINASDHGVPQLRPRFVLVCTPMDLVPGFNWPEHAEERVTVGSTLESLMAADRWPYADRWASAANQIAPTIVGGSKKHGGADLGPTRAREAWLKLRVDGRGVADRPPPENAPADLIPRLTNEMVARIQGFPEDWEFYGRKTSVYRQIGNAFPPPVAGAIARSVRSALLQTEDRDEQQRHA